jgi:hypothetical protein
MKTLANLPDPVLRLVMKASRASLDFSYFARQFWPCVPGAGTVIWNWHMTCICDELQDMAERLFRGEPKKYDLVINVPFGSSKSTLCSILFPCWVPTRFPQARFITATHTDTLVRDFMEKSMAVFLSEQYRDFYPEIQITKSTGDVYKNNFGGERRACTVGGKTPTGFHAHFLNVDDPIDPQGARSELELETASKFMREVIQSRVVDKQISVLYLIMQRLHYRDPTAVMEEIGAIEGSKPVRKICLPGELTEHVFPPLEFLQAKYRDERTGELPYGNGVMDEKRLPASELKRFRVTLGDYGYAGQVLQEPSPPGGAMFKIPWFNQRVRSAPYVAERVRYWDRAACLVANTLIETSNGPRPIQTIRTGDLVLTRNGYRQVCWAGISGYVDELASVLFSDGSVLTGTPDHPVWDEGRGNWVDLAMLDGSSYNLGVAYGEELRCQDHETRSWNQSSSMESITAASRGGSISRPSAGIPYGNDLGRMRCTEPFGASITVLSPLAIRFITGMGIATTTTLKILNASLLESTTGATEFFGSGIERQQLGNITGKLATWVMRQQLRRTGTFVNNVVGNGHPERWGCPQNSALPFAASASAIAKFPNIANDVGGNSCAGPRPNFAINAAPKWGEGSGKIPVYDLSVAGDHEFFASGVLVHNTQDGGCFTAGPLMARDAKNRYYVEHMKKGQWNPDERNDHIVAMARRDRSKYGPRNEPVIVIEGERGSTGEESFRNIYRRLTAELPGIRVREDLPTGSKDVRAEPWANTLAAGSVWIVENETDPWDVNGFIQEHILFRPDLTAITRRRVGGFKDQVDACSGAYNFLSKRHGGNVGMRILSVGAKRGMPRIVFGPEVEVMRLLLDHNFLLIKCGDCFELSPRTFLEIPPEGEKPRLLGSCLLCCSDLQPAKIQDDWMVGRGLYGGRKAEEVIYHRDQARKLWQFLLRKRPTPPEVFMFADDRDDEYSFVQSVAMAVGDILALPRESTLFDVMNPDNKVGGADEPPNRYVYDMTRTGRMLAMV